MRKHYLDNIRWITVFIVVIYHVLYMFNGQGVFGGLGPMSKVQYQDGFLYMVYPWFMALLFLVAGISARHSLEKRSASEFLAQRNLTLLIPSTLGLLVFHFLTGLFMMTTSGMVATTPKALIYPIAALAGTGPLWFSQVLWLLSVILLGILRFGGAKKLLALGEKISFIGILLLVVPVWGASQILNAPMITVYRFGIYGLVFLLGYFVFSHQSVIDRIKVHRFWLVPMALVLGLAYSLVHFGQPYADLTVLQSFFTNGFAWLAILAILAGGSAWLNFSNPWTKKFSSLSQGIYILHYLPIAVVGWLLKEKTNLAAIWVYAGTLVAVIILPPLLYEIIRRIPILKTLVLGIRGKKRAER